MQKVTGGDFASAVHPVGCRESQLLSPALGVTVT